MDFRKWLEDDGYDQGLNDMGLAYMPPSIPSPESRRSKKIEKLFKGKRGDSSPAINQSLPQPRTEKKKSDRRT